jgi:hypothetical protein
MSTVTATSGPAGDIRLTLYGQGGDDVMMITLSPRRALLLGADLVNLAARSVLTLGAGDPNSLIDDGQGNPAGPSAGITRGNRP